MKQWNFKTLTDPGRLSGTSALSTTLQIPSLSSVINSPLNASSTAANVNLHKADPLMYELLDKNNL